MTAEQVRFSAQSCFLPSCTDVDPKRNPQKAYCTEVSDSKSVSQRTQPHKDISALFKLESTMSHAFPSLSLQLQSVPILQQSPTLPRSSKSLWALNLDSGPNSAIYFLGPLGNYWTSLVQFPNYKLINEHKGSYSYSSQQFLIIHSCIENWPHVFTPQIPG